MEVADERSATVALAARGIGVAPGEPFLVRPDTDHLRVTVGLIPDDHLTAVADHLAAAAGRPPPPRPPPLTPLTRLRSRIWLPRPTDFVTKARMTFRSAPVRCPQGGVEHRLITHVTIRAASQHGLITAPATRSYRCHPPAAAHRGSRGWLHPMAPRVYGLAGSAGIHRPSADAGPSLPRIGGRREPRSSSSTARLRPLPAGRRRVHGPSWPAQRGLAAFRVHSTGHCQGSIG